MRVLVTSTPGAGHVLPLAPLAQALVGAGHRLWWAAGPDARRLVSAAGMAHRTAGLDQPTRMERFAAGWPHVRGLPPVDRRAVMFPVLFGTLSAAAMYDDLRSVADDVRPDVIVHEPAELAAAPLARRLGIPHVTVGFGRAIPPALLAAASAEVAPLWAEAGVAAPVDCGVYEHLYLHPLPTTLDHLPAGAPDAGLRPLHDHDWQPRARSRRDGDPLVYLTFGTEFGAPAPWDAVLGALAALPVRVLVAVGALVDPTGWGALPSSIRVERWVPQQEALADADLVVSHGGAGSMIGGFAAGIPHLVLPLGADHFDNGELIAGAGLGRVLRPEQVAEASVRTAVEQLLADVDARRRVEALRSEMSALPPPSAAVTRIEQLVRSSRTR